MTDPQPPPKKSDLPVRVASAAVMVAVAGTALWFGGRYFEAFLLLLGFGLLWEWWGLVSKVAQTVSGRLVAMFLGMAYIGWALKVVQFLWIGPHLNTAPPFFFVVSAMMVILVDVGAYFAGRTFGGPKIAPSISPSKTWAGLFGGMAAAIAFALAVVWRDSQRMPSDTFRQYVVMAVLFAMAITLIAQCGDFFESWLKRRAGVKDSGTLIPGHGGLLDRLDGHLLVFATLPAVIFVVATIGEALG